MNAVEQKHSRGAFRDGKPITRGPRRSKPVLDSNVTNEQEAYCRGRAMGMSMEEAIAAAGLSYSAKTTRSWERNVPAVKKRIQELSDIATKNAIIHTGLDREWVITRLMQVVDRCMGTIPVLDGNGEPTGEYKFDASGANAALKMLGDTMGLFKPAEKKEGDDYAELSDDDIARIAQELAASTGLLEAPARVEAAPGPQQVIEVQAVPEAGVLSRGGGEVPRETLPRWEPVGQDVEQRLRDRLPPDGAVSDVVEGQAVESGGDGLGAWRVDGVDPGHDAAPDPRPAG
jgi:phage terminase small subunit